MTVYGMKRIIIPPEGKEDQARFRAEKDDWLLLATSKKATKAVYRVAPFIFVHLNAKRADFHWGVKGIADALTMSVPQVERALKWLREHGLIAKLGRDGRHGTSIYALSLPCTDPSL
jgi:DNA-binding transcriptional ArsR family regulator